MASARIVIADDDPAILQTMTWVLKEHGYDVGSATSGRDLMALLEERTPDLLLLDVMFSDVDGFQLLERIKNDARWRDMPVLMISSLPPEEAAVKTLGLGASDFVRKPFRVRELLARIQAQLRMRAILRSAYESLRVTEEELARARAEADSRRKLVDILREVTGDLTSNEIYHVLARRVARALDLTRCSVILARPGDRVGMVAASFEHALVKNFELNLDRYPEIRAALDTGQPVLVEDVHSSPLYADIRERWQEEGTRVPIRSVIAMPFSLADAQQSGVFFLRRGEDERPLREDDVSFADTVVRAAVAAVQRADMLRSLVGDSAFFRGLRSYYLANRHSTALTDDLRRAVEASSGRPLGWFFDQWLRRPGFAEVTTSWRYEASQRRVIATVAQGGRFGAYRFPLTVSITDAAGKERRATIDVPAAANTTIVVPVQLDAAPRGVAFDPDVRVLAAFQAR